MKSAPKFLILSFVTATAAACAGDTNTSDDDLLGCGCEDDPSGPPGIGLGADVTIDVAGVGLSIGLDPQCGLTLSGQFAASVSGSVVFDGTAWAVADLTADASLEIGDGCACNGIRVEAIASIELHAKVPADANACSWFCASTNGDENCLPLCGLPGNILTATGSITADAAIDLGGAGDALDLDGLVGQPVELVDWVLCNAAGIPL